MEKIQKKLIVFMPSMDGGGVEKNIIIITNYLSDFIEEITLITFDKRFNNQFKKNIKIINAQQNYNRDFSKYYKYFFCLKILAKKIIKDNKISVFSFQANIYCIMLSKILNFNLIVRSNSSPSGWTNNKIKDFVFKVLFKSPDYVIVNSFQFAKEIYKRFNVRAKVIYNPLNKFEILKKCKEKINFNFKYKKTLKIINIARFTDQKDHLTLLKAFQIINTKINAELLIMGYGANKKIMCNFIKRNKLEKKIKIVGFQKNPYPFIKKADVFVLSSLYEGLPNVLLEALTLKKFVISSDCPTGPKEILENGKYGFLFEVGNIKQLANQIVMYSQNKKKYNKKIDLGYKSLQRFDFNTNCNKYLSLVKKILC
jgi:glycosyltransferase involved in cell wall biosynthesis